MYCLIELLLLIERSHLLYQQIIVRLISLIKVSVLRLKIKFHLNLTFLSGCVSAIVIASTLHINISVYGWLIQYVWNLRKP